MSEIYTLTQLKAVLTPVFLQHGVQRAVGKDVDLFDVTHIQPGSKIDNEIRRTGVMVSLK